MGQKAYLITVSQRFNISSPPPTAQTKQPPAASPQATVAEQPTEEPAEEGKTKKKKDKVGIIWHWLHSSCCMALFAEREAK